MNERRFSRPILAGLMVTVCLGNAVCTGETILIDNFNDCNDDGWTHDSLAATVPTWDPAFVNDSTSSCAYRLAAAEGSGTLVGASWNGSEVVNNGFFRARVRAETPETAFLIGMRNHNPAPQFNELGDAYVAVVNLRKQSMTLSKFVSFGDLAVTDLAMGANEDWFVQIGAVGDEISAKAWRVGDPEPPAQLTVTDPAGFAGGRLVISAGVEGGDPIGIGGAVFDDLTFIVPEPSSALMSGIGLLGILASRRQRKSFAIHK